jgi:Tfp pilus assembly protein PilW
MQENVRFAADALTRDVRMAGYGLAVRESELDTWISWVSGMTANPNVTDGGTGTDRISIAAAFDLPLATLSQAAPAGTTTLRLAAANGLDFNTTNRCVVYVGRAETARVTATSAGSLTISTDPVTDGVGLVYEHPVGAPVELVQVHSYYCSSNTTYDAGQVYLVLDNHENVITQDWQRMVAGHITDFQVTPGTYSVSLAVEAKTAKRLYTYTDPMHGDAYQRARVTTQLTPRNDAAYLLRH